MTEFKRFIETLRMLGIFYLIDWQPKKEVWQQHVIDAGFNFTVASSTAISIGPLEFLFANGQADWKDDNGFGPEGAFILSRNTVTGEVTNRQAFNQGTGDPIPPFTGLAALRHAYNF